MAETTTPTVTLEEAVSLSQSIISVFEDLNRIPARKSYAVELLETLGTAQWAGRINDALVELEAELEVAVVGMGTREHGQSIINAALNILHRA